jgi:hypothetical protein
MKAQRYDKSQVLDQLQEWVKTFETPIPYIATHDDNFSQEDIFHDWTWRLSGHAHVNQLVVAKL